MNGSLAVEGLVVLADGVLLGGLDGDVGRELEVGWHGAV